MIRHVLLFLILLGSPMSSALAQKVGDVMEVIIRAGLFSTPPKGLFCSSGEQKGSIEPGRRVRIRSIVQVSCALFRNYEYIEVEPVDGDEPRQSMGFAKFRDPDGSEFFRPVPP